MGRLTALAGLFLFPLYVGAQKPGDLDASFGDEGVVSTVTENGRGFRGPGALALQPDGKIVVVGHNSFFVETEGVSRSTSDFALQRYESDGTLDTTFGDMGMSTTDFSGMGDFAHAVAVQPDGKIIVGGATSPINGASDSALARYRPDGSLDTTFGGTGVVTAASDIRFLLGFAIQPHDGRLVVATQDFSSDGDTLTLPRYHAVTCGGVVVTRVGTAGNDTIMGTSGPDVILGFDGNDLISGLGGKDILCGGKGDDILRGGPGTDACDGGSGSADQALECEQVSNVP